MSVSTYKVRLDLNLLVLWRVCLDWRVFRGISTCCRHFLKKRSLTGDKTAAGLLTEHKTHLVLLLHIWNSPCSLILKLSWSSNDAAAFWKGSWILCWKLCKWRGWERCWRSRAMSPRSSAPLGCDSPDSGPVGCEGQRRESSRTRRHLWEQTRGKKWLIFAKLFVTRNGVNEVRGQFSGNAQSCQVNPNQVNSIVDLS